MILLRKLVAFASAIIDANRFGKLFLLSDRELAACCTDRARLVQGYTHDLGAH